MNPAIASLSENQEQAMTVEIGERVAAPVIPVKSVPDVLRHAARIIEERGWHKFNREAGIGSGPVCLTGAIEVARYGRIDWEQDDRSKDDHATLYMTGRLGDPPDLWNDIYAQSPEHVTRILRAAADAYETSHAARPVDW